MVGWLVVHIPSRGVQSSNDSPQHHHQPKIKNAMHKVRCGLLLLSLLFFAIYYRGDFRDKKMELFCLQTDGFINRERFQLTPKCPSVAGLCGLPLMTDGVSSRLMPVGGMEMLKIEKATNHKDSHSKSYIKWPKKSNFHLKNHCLESIKGNQTEYKRGFILGVRIIYEIFSFPF